MKNNPPLEKQELFFMFMAQSASRFLVLILTYEIPLKSSGPAHFLLALLEQDWSGYPW